MSRQKEFIDWVANKFDMSQEEARAIVKKCDSLFRRWESEYKSSRSKGINEQDLDRKYMSSYGLPVKPIQILNSDSFHLVKSGSINVKIENGWLVWEWSNGNRGEQ